MRRPGTRAAHTGADAGHAGPCRAVRGVPRTVVPVGRDFAAGARSSRSVGEPVPVAADSGESGGGAHAPADAMVALGCSGRRTAGPGGPAATVDENMADRETGQSGVAHGKCVAGSPTGRKGVRAVD